MEGKETLQFLSYSEKSKDVADGTQVKGGAKETMGFQHPRKAVLQFFHPRKWTHVKSEGSSCGKEAAWPQCFHQSLK